MVDTRPDGATNARPLNEGVAGTGPGIPDEARGPGEQLPDPPSDEEVEQMARRLGAHDKRDANGREQTSGEPNAQRGSG